MKLKLKIYKFYKLKQFLKNHSLFFIYHTNSLNSNNWKKLEKKLTKLNLNYYKIQNKLFIRLLKQSIFKNLILLINGPILIVFPKYKTIKKLNLKALLSLHNSLQLISFKLNNKFYLLSQMKNLKTFNYRQTVSIFKNLITNLNKISLYKLKKISEFSK